MIGLLAGVVAGLMVSAVLVTVTLLLTRKHVARRRHGWRTFGVGTGLLVPLLWGAVYFHPWPTVRPGGDYDIALGNLFLGGLAYAAAPGVAAVVVLFGVLMLRRADSPSQPQVRR